MIKVHILFSSVTTLQIVVLHLGKWGTKLYLRIFLITLSFPCSHYPWINNDKQIFEVSVNSHLICQLSKSVVICFETKPECLNWSCLLMHSEHSCLLYLSKNYILVVLCARGLALCFWIEKFSPPSLSLLLGRLTPLFARHCRRLHFPHCGMI